MNLFELKKQTDLAIEKANEYGIDPKNINVSLQIDVCNDDGDFLSSYYSYGYVELNYDNDLHYSGCVLSAISVFDRKE